MAKRKVRHQPRILGGREPLPSCVLGEIKECLEQDAKDFGVSKSWVNSTILAKHYGIKGQPDFHKVPPLKVKR